MRTRGQALLALLLLLGGAQIFAARSSANSACPLFDPDGACPLFDPDSACPLFDCVARCPGAVASAEACDDVALCIDQRRLSSTGKTALVVGIVATVVVVVAAAWALDARWAQTN